MLSYVYEVHVEWSSLIVSFYEEYEQEIKISDISNLDDSNVLFL